MMSSIVFRCTKFTRQGNVPAYYPKYSLWLPSKKAKICLADIGPPHLMQRITGEHFNSNPSHLVDWYTYQCADDHFCSDVYWILCNGKLENTLPLTLYAW